MTDLTGRIAALSPEKRRLLELRMQQREASVAGRPIRPRHNTGDPLPLSFAQARLWFLWRLDPESAAYNISAALRLRGYLDTTVLRRAFEEIVRRHESLRTTFGMMGSQPVQMIAATGELAFEIVDLGALEREAQEAEARRRASIEAAQPFNLEVGPLLRLRLLRLAPDEHVLLLTMHHIISDGWSTEVLIRELAALYAAYLSDQPSPLPALAIQYADYALWQREHLDGELRKAQLAYWKEQLGGRPPVLDLPTDRPRPAVPSYRGNTVQFDIPSGLFARLQGLSQEAGATVFMGLLAVLQVLLHRHSQQERIGVGTPIANRNRQETENSIGFFVNTLVMCTDLSGRPTFRELLRRVREVALGAYAHQELPFEALVEALQLPRDTGHSPLFQVMFVLQDDVVKELRLPGLSASLLRLPSITAKFDLTLIIERSEQRVTGTFEYSTDLFESDTVGRLAEHYLRLLSALVTEPERPVDEAAMLTAAERRQLLATWNPQVTKETTSRCIHELVEEQAAARPWAPAVVCGTDRISYGELEIQANQLAHWLQEVGVGPETRVGIYLERSAAWLVAILGVLKAGGAYVPLDPDYPAQRIAFMLADTRAAVILTHDHLVERLPDLGRHAARVLRLDADGPQLAQRPQQRPPYQATLDNLAYVIYTSGSTGAPKGVMVEHRQLVHSTTARFAFYRDPVTTTLVLPSFSFDGSLAGVFWTLCQGGALILPPAGDERDPSRLARLLEQHAISHVICLSSVYELILAQIGSRLAQQLKVVVMGGEICAPELAARHLQQMPATLLCNEYGPTEGTVWCTVYPVDPKRRSQWQRRVPIGRPIPGSQVYLLDTQRQPTPIGVPGELYIGGAGVARGYLNRPDLTAERFLEHDFVEIGRVRLYRTGDLGRYLPDGNIEFLGRADDQVKMRGHRIEPREIEAVLRRHPAVQATAVLTHQDSQGELRLVAYATPADGTEPGADVLASWLRQELPEFMLPAAIIFVDQIPRLPNGKVDRNALPAPEFGQGAGRSSFVAPRNDLEQQIATTWREVLSVERLSVHDNFFDLGGHSLRAARCMARISADLALELPLRLLFDRPTIAGLAERIGALRQQGVDLTGASILRRQNPGEPTPLSFSQQRLWFLQRFEPQSPAYNVPSALRLHGVLDVSALRRSLVEIVRRHEVLRTTFQVIDGQPFQVIAPEGKYAFGTSDISQLSGEALEAEVRRRAREEAQQPFDLETGPLLRTQLLRLAVDEHILLMTLHHIVSDGWSAEVLIRELTALYGAFVADAPSPLPELKVQYADYAEWQRKHLAGELRARELAYWKEQLGDKPPVLALPTDHVRPAQPSYRGDSVEFEIPTGLLARLHELCLQEGATDFMGLTAVFQALLHRYSDQERISVGTPVANRTRRETEELVGFFVNTLVLCTDLAGQPTFRELLRRVREVALGAYAHQELPFEALVEALQLPRDTGRSPLFQVMFVLQDDVVKELRLPGLSASLLRLPSTAAKFDLTLMVGRSEQRATGMFEYSTDLFEPGTVARLGDHFVRLLEAAVADPDQRVAQLPLLAPAEARQLLVEWNATAASYPAHQSLHQQIEAWAALTPDAEAVRLGSHALTYAALNRRANQLAHHLAALGAGPGVPVGLCMERSVDLVVAILAILKSGAAYLPLDPRYPQQRLAFMVTDSQTPIVLADQQLTALLADAAHDRRILCLDADATAAAIAMLPCSMPASNPPSRTAGRELAYVIYTSGSTGQPKGVCCHHAGVINLLTDLQRRQPIGAGDRCSWFTSLSFDGSVLEIFSALTSGATLEIVPEELRTDALRFSQWLLDRQITCALIPPMLIADFARWLRAGQRILPLRRVIVGIEPLNELLLAEINQHLPAGVIIDGYGPTETTICSTLFTVQPDIAQDRRIPIGRPVQNTQLYVLDAHQQPVPIGVPGELYIGGDGVAHGYLHRPELTAERFVPNPFATAPRGRLYKTGDLVRYLADGNLMFIGRVDNQVKMRGFRIEPGEIEHVIGQHPGVQAAAVAPHRDQLGEVRLVGYIVAREDAAPTASELKGWLREQLPEHMVPAAIIFIPKIPLSPNGKVDRRALPAPEFDLGAGRTPFVAPRNDLEQRIMVIWDELLPVPAGRIGVHDNFFDLGGHSLLAARCMARISADLALELPIRLLFDRPTIAGLAERIAAMVLVTGQANQASLLDTNDREEGEL